MKLNIAIIDDQAVDRAKLKEEIAKWSHERNCAVDIMEYERGDIFLSRGFDNINTVHIVFLDVQMNGITGIDVAKSLREHDYLGDIVFLSAFREYVFNGYEVHALNYLLKPIVSQSLYLCLDEAYRKCANAFYTIRCGSEINTIPYTNIICFSSRLHTVEILTVDGLYVQNVSLNNSIEFLPNEFVRVHRCFIVNLAHVRSISGKNVVLSNQKTVPIGRTYSKDIVQKFLLYSNRFNRR